MKTVFSMMLLVLAIVVFSVPSESQADLKPISSDTLIWGGCGITKKAFMADLAKAYEKKTNIHIDLQGGGATKGIRGVSQGVINIGGACRAAMEFHNEERYVKQIPVAWDAIVFVVNKSNPVDNITMDQVRDIYEGRISNWKDLGGLDEPIELYVRKSPISGVGQTLRELVFKDSENEFTNKAIIVKSSGPAEKAVESSAAAMTATGISSAKHRNVKILKVGGHEPSYENIKAGQYILYRPIYLVTKLREKDPKVIKFLKFVNSDEGIAIIRRSGTVPYSDALHLLSKHFHQYDR